MRLALAVLAVIVATPAFAQSTGNNGGGNGQGGTTLSERTGVICVQGAAAGNRGCGRKKGSDTVSVIRVPVPQPRTVTIATPPTPKKKPGRKVAKATGEPKLAALPRARPADAPTFTLVGDFVTDEVLVALDGDAAAASTLASRFNLTIRAQRTSTLIGRRLVRFGIPDGRPPRTVLAALAGEPGIAADVNSIFTLQGVRAPLNYAFERIGLPDKAASGRGVAIAVIDSAADRRHPALKKAYAGFYDALPDYPVVDAGHGTSIGGLIAGTGPVPGMAPGARLFHARAFENGKSTMAAILDAFDWAAGQKVRIVNMSFAGPSNRLMAAACDGALARGIVLVAAAGNNGPDAGPAYPGAYPGVIAVTATDAADALMPQANRGDYVFVAAPGVDVVAPVPGGGADFVTGTSFSAAIVSGAIANLIAADTSRDAAWVTRAVEASARDLGPSGRDTDFGNGLIDVAGAGQVAAN